jgi:hypothetical protein
MARDRYYGAGGWGHAVDFREMNIGFTQVHFPQLQIVSDFLFRN